MERTFPRSIVRPESAFARCGFRPSKGYKDAKAGIFPPPVVLSTTKSGQPRASGFLSDELDAWIAAKAAGASDEELRALVRELVAARKPSATSTSGGGRPNA